MSNEQDSARVAFERWLSGRRFMLDGTDQFRRYASDGTYVDASTRAAWDAWNAAPVTSPTRAALHELMAAIAEIEIPRPTERFALASKAARNTLAQSERAEPLAWEMDRVLLICDAYESGMGHGLGKRDLGNPYAPGTDGHRAYKLGQDEGASRAPAAPPPAARDVLAERERQKSVEGWTPEHDDEHTRGELQIAAACLCVDGTDAEVHLEGAQIDQWGLVARHHGNWRRELVIACALILAEIERIDRERGRIKHG